MRLLTLLIIVGLSPMLAAAQVQIFRKEVRQVMGGAQSLDDVRAAAIAKARRDALEAAATWLESRTEVRTLELARDKVTALANGIAQTRVVREQPFVEGGAVGLRVAAEARVDTSGLAERVRHFLADRHAMEQARAINAREQQLLAHLAELEFQMANLKARGEPAAPLRAAVQENARKLMASEWFDKGWDLLDWGQILLDRRQLKYRDPHDAIVNFTEALRLDPTFARAYVLRGYAYQQLGQYARAIKDYDEALRVEPSLVAAYGNRGNAYHELGDHARAIQDYDRALHLDRNNSTVYYNRGVAYYKGGAYQLAIRDFDEALRLDHNNAFAYNNRGIAYSAVGQNQRAIEDLSQALRLNPTLADVRFNRGNAYAKLGQHQLAIEDYDQFLRMNPT